MAAPKAPDASQTAKDQQGYNQQAGISQAGLNMVNQSNPYGSLTYQQIGTNPDGTPRFAANTQLNSGEQNIFNQNQALRGQAGQAASGILSRAGGMLAGPPPDLNSTGITKSIMDWGSQYLQPQFDQQNASTAAKLQNQGIQQGSDAWNNAMNLNSRNQGDQMNNLLIGGQGTALQSLENQQQYPMELLNAAGSAAGMAAPGSVNSSLVNTPNETVNPVDYAGLQNTQYQNQLNSYNNMMSGLFAIPTAVAGGASMAGKLPFGL